MREIHIITACAVSHITCFPFIIIFHPVVMWVIFDDKTLCPLPVLCAETVSKALVDWLSKDNAGCNLHRLWRGQVLQIISNGHIATWKYKKKKMFKIWHLFMTDSNIQWCKLLYFFSSSFAILNWKLHVVSWQYSMYCNSELNVTRPETFWLFDKLGIEKLWICAYFKILFASSSKLLFPS